MAARVRGGRGEPAVRRRSAATRARDLAERTTRVALDRRARSPARSSPPCRRSARTSAIIHAQQADRAGNVQLWGISGVQKEAVLASRALDRDGRGDRRPSSSRGPARSSCPAWAVDRGRARARRRAPVVRARLLRPRQRLLRRAGTRSAATARRFRAWMRTHVLEHGEPTPRVTRVARHGALHGRRDDGRRRRAAARATAPSASSGSGCRAARRTSPARRTRPGCVLIYESGTIGAKPTHLPLSIGDGELAETADAVVSVPEIFALLAPGRPDRRRLPRRRADRPLRQPQQHGDRRLRAAEGAAAGRAAARPRSRPGAARRS